MKIVVKKDSEGERAAIIKTGGTLKGERIERLFEWTDEVEVELREGETITIVITEGF